MRLLRRIAKDQNRSVVIVSHDQRIKDIADRVLWLEDGEFKGDDGDGNRSGMRHGNRADEGGGDTGSWRRHLLFLFARLPHRIRVRASAKINTPNGVLILANRFVEWGIKEETNTMKKLLIPLLLASVLLAACSNSASSAPQVITMDTNLMKFQPAMIEVKVGQSRQDDDAKQ